MQSATKAITEFQTLTVKQPDQATSALAEIGKRASASGSLNLEVLRGHGSALAARQSDGQRSAIRPHFQWRFGQPQPIFSIPRPFVDSPPSPVETQQFVGPNWVFELAGFSFAWQSTAEELHRAARLLVTQIRSDNAELATFVKYCEEHPETPTPHKPSLWNTAILLYGFALENLLKGLVLFKFPDYISDGRLRGPVITSHNLLHLAEKANVELSAREKAVSKFLTEAISAWGRYPIPLGKNNMKSMVRVSSQAFVVCEALYIRFHGLYESRFHSRTRKGC